MVQYYDQAVNWTKKNKPVNTSFDTFYAISVELLGKTDLPGPSDWRGWYQRGNALAELGLFESALESFTKSISINPNVTYLYWYRAALLHLVLGDTEGYLQTCQLMLKHSGKTKSAYKAHWIAQTCTLSPESVEDWSMPLALAKLAMADEVESKKHTGRGLVGEVLYRADRFEEAINILNEEVADWDKNGLPLVANPPHTLFFLSMAHYRRGNLDEALLFYNQAIEWIEQKGIGAVTWSTTLRIQLIRQEAESLIYDKALERQEKI